MTNIIALLMMALNLLTAVQGNPNLTPEFRVTAIAIANIALDRAQQALIQGTTTTAIIAQNPLPPVFTAPVPQLPSPIFIGTINPPIPTPIVENHLVITQQDFNPAMNTKANGFNYGTYLLRASVVDKDGKYLEGISVSMNAPDNDESMNKAAHLNRNTSESITNAKTQDFGAAFIYAPTTIGSKTITFTAGNLTKTFEIEVK